MTSSYKTITAIITRTANSKNTTVLTWSVDLSEEKNHWRTASTNYPQRIKMEKKKEAIARWYCLWTYIHSKTAKMAEKETKILLSNMQGETKF